MNDDIERALRKFPDTFRVELAAIQAGARNGGRISPRRHAGLLTEYERVAAKYRAKLATLRGHGSSSCIYEAEHAIEAIHNEFASLLAA